MSAIAHVAIHPSQFPERVRGELLESLRSRRVNHKFHYDSVKQTMQWLALHQAYAPSRTDVDCAAVYDHSFRDVISRIPLGTTVHLVGLGCGGGQKDTRLIQNLRDKDCEVFYTPLDVSTAMVLVARSVALQAIPLSHCFPFVCDLVAADFGEELQSWLTTTDAEQGPRQPVVRLFTFFGMIPNFESQAIMPKLAYLIGPQDFLLLSANLAPGDDYDAGVRRVLPLYDNTLTRDWLMMFLQDLGIETQDGEIRFEIEDTDQLKRIAAYFEFNRAREIHLDEERFRFCSGDRIRLFFSYRHTAALVQSLLQPHGLRVLNQWITRSQEEGVFLIGRRD